MTMKTLRNTALLLVFAAAVSCQSPVPSRPTAPSESPLAGPAHRTGVEMGGVYRQAETAYSQGEYEKAVELYSKFLASSPPTHPMADSALFKIGMSWFELKRYKDALSYFNSIINSYPGSQNRSEARVNAAICMLHLNQLDEAETAFDRALDVEPNEGVRSYIFFYKGSIEEKRGSYNTAARFYIHSGLSSQNEELLNRAKLEVERLFANFLGEAQLEDIRSRYSGQWPAGLAITALIRIYAAKGEGEKLALARAELGQYPPSSIAIPGSSGAGEETYRPKEIKIGAALPLSGQGGSAGMEMIQGIQLAMNSYLQLMKEKKIQLIIKDTGAEGGAEKALEDLASDKDTLVILGPAYSDEFKKSASTAERHRIPVVSPSATEEGAGALSRLLFRTALTGRVEARRMAELAVRTLGLKRFVIISGADRQGRELSQYFAAEVERLGGEVAASETYNMDQNDFGAQIKKLGGISDPELREMILNMAKAPGGGGVDGINAQLARLYAEKLGVPRIVSHKKLPLNERNFLPGLTLRYDAIYIPGVYGKVGLILPQLEFYNIKGVAKLSNSGANHPGLVRIAEKYADGLILTDGFNPGSRSPKVSAFANEYRLYFRAEPTILSAQAYDAAVMALNAIAQGAGTRGEIAAAFGSLSGFEGVTGSMRLMADGEMDKTAVFMVVAAGRITEMAMGESGPASTPGEASATERPAGETVDAAKQR